MLSRCAGVTESFASACVVLVCVVDSFGRGNSDSIELEPGPFREPHIRVVSGRTGFFVLKVFTSTSTVVFTTFACDDGAVEGESYLRADYGISCNTDKHVWYKVYAGIMILVSSCFGTKTLVAGVALRSWRVITVCCCEHSL